MMQDVPLVSAYFCAKNRNNRSKKTKIKHQKSVCKIMMILMLKKLIYKILSLRYDAVLCFRNGKKNAFFFDFRSFLT